MVFSLSPRGSPWSPLALGGSRISLGPRGSPWLSLPIQEGLHGCLSQSKRGSMVSLSPREAPGFPLVQGAPRFPLDQEGLHGCLSIQEGLHGLPWPWGAPGTCPQGLQPPMLHARSQGGRGAPSSCGERRREGGAVTWPDDGFQQGDPSSQDLQPGLLPQEGLEATGLGESERAEQSARSPRGGHGLGGTAQHGWHSMAWVA